MSEGHDVQELSDIDIHVYEAVAAQAQAGGRAPLSEVIRATGLEEDEVRASLATLVTQGYIVPLGDGYGLGPHTFEVEY
jgi:DNA-binding IclR family transcriptional regulator